VRREEMKRKINWTSASVVALTLATLIGCVQRLPPEAEEAVLGPYDPQIYQPVIISVDQVEPLPEDVAVGAEEVWCVNLTVRCVSPFYWTRDEYPTCGDSRLVRLIDGQYQVSVLMDEEDEAKWEERGCELMEVQVDAPSQRAPW
jgi:hypothetical protein